MSRSQGTVHIPETTSPLDGQKELGRPEELESSSTAIANSDSAVVDPASESMVSLQEMEGKDTVLVSKSESETELNELIAGMKEMRVQWQEDALEKLTAKMDEVEAQWKEDRERLDHTEVEWKRDSEMLNKMEVQWKEDTDKWKRMETQCKEDAEKIQARWKENAKRIEARWKEDSEKLENMRVLMKEQIDALEKDNKALQYQADRLDEKVQNLSTKISDINIYLDFEAKGEAVLDRIKLNHLIERAQAKLALSLGISSDTTSAPFQFREALGIDSSLEERTNKLKEMITERKNDLQRSDSGIFQLADSALAMLANPSSVF